MKNAEPMDTPNEELRTVENAVAMQLHIQKEIRVLTNQINLLREKEGEYFKMAVSLCEKHDYRRIPYDPYSPLICEHCNHHKY